MGIIVENLNPYFLLDYKHKDKKWQIRLIHRGNPFQSTFFLKRYFERGFPCGAIKIS
jgi:hypothetical protein